MTYIQGVAVVIDKMAILCEKNKSKIYNKSFPYDISFSRKDSLKVCQLYLNLTNTGLDKSI